MERNQSDDKKSYKKKYDAQRKYINVGFLKSTHKDLLKVAKMNGYSSVNKFLQFLAERELSGETSSPKIVQEVHSSCRFLLRNIKNNMNQLSHHSPRLNQVLIQQRLSSQIQKYENNTEEWISRMLDPSHIAGKVEDLESELKQISDELNILAKDANTHGALGDEGAVYEELRKLDDLFAKLK